MNRKLARSGALLLLAIFLAACGPAPAPTTAPPQPTAAPPQPTAVPPQSTAVPPPPTAGTTSAAPTAVPPTQTLLPTEPPGPVSEVLSQAGLSYKPVPGYTVAYGYDRVVLSAPDADPAVGPLIEFDSNPFLCAESVPVNLQDAFERARDCLPWMYNIEEAEVTDPVEVNVDDRFGYAADIDGTISGQQVRLHFIVLKPGTMRALVITALATDDHYVEVAGPFEDLVASIDLLTWTTYSDGNDVQDVAFFEGYLWTATSGGVVNYDLGGGLSPEKYTTADGLPANDARALVVCPILGEPTLVVGTWGGGLAWFDFGMRRWFDMGGPYSEWHSDYVRALACAPDRNRLIVGYDDGIDIYDADEVLWTFVSSEEGLPDGLQSLAASPDGEAVWVVGRQEIARIIGYEVEGFTLSGDYLGQAALDETGSLWIGTETGVGRLSAGGEWTLYAAAAAAAADVADLAVGPVSGVVVAPDDTVWAGSEGHVARFDPQTGQVTAVYTREQGMGAGVVTRMAVQEDGWLASGTSTGASVLRDDEWTFYRLEDEPLLDNWIVALAQDTDGLIWVGTETAGIFRFDPRNPAGRWDNFYGELPDPSITTLYADPEGGMWVGHVGGVSSYDGQSWLHLADELPELAGFYAHDMVKDDRGRLWLAGDTGLYIWDGQELAALTTADGLPSASVRALLPDGEAMWVGTLGGLARVEGGKVQVPEAENSDLPDSAVNALALDRNGTLLVASSLYLLWRDTDGHLYPLLETYNGADVVALATVASGEHWVVTDRDGAYHLVFQGEGADWVHLPALEGPPANSYRPHSILVDRDGTVWLGGATGGVARYGR